MVDRYETCVQVWSFSGGQATFVSYAEGDTLATPLLPGLSSPVHDIRPQI